MARTDHHWKHRQTRGQQDRRVVTFAALTLVAAALAGCADLGDSMASSAFVDPAKYDLYNCKQLATERVALGKRVESLQKLIDKANTGAGGAVIGEMVYRNDYVTARAQSKAVDDAWRVNRCTEAPAGAATATTTIPAASAPVTVGPETPRPSGPTNGVY